MTNYIIRGFSDGSMYCKSLPKSSKENPIRLGHRGFGDSIIILSNSPNGKVLVSEINGDWKEVLRISGRTDIQVDENRTLYDDYIKKSWDNESLGKVSGMKVINSYVTGDYIRLDEKHFRKYPGLPKEYITTQTIGKSKKARIDDPKMLDKYIKSYGLPIFDLNAMHKIPLSQTAYIIQNAKFHVGIDSGSTHLALTIKNKSDVHICLNPNRLTDVGKKWIEYDYNVKLIS